MKRIKQDEEALVEFLKKRDIFFKREKYVTFNFLLDTNKQKSKNRFFSKLEYYRCLVEVKDQQHKSENYSMICDNACMMNVVAHIKASKTTVLIHCGCGSIQTSS